MPPCCKNGSQSCLFRKHTSFYTGNLCLTSLFLKQSSGRYRDSQRRSIQSGARETGDIAHREWQKLSKAPELNTHWHRHTTTC